MTDLLISVKDISEALLALDAHVDLIDLKDPMDGALGALDLETTKKIVLTVDKQASISATVGEGHKTVDRLVYDILARHVLGVDVIKLAFSELFEIANFPTEIRKLTRQKIKLVVVFFAEDTIDLSLLVSLKKMGFYGAMIDTKQKKIPLIMQQPVTFLHKFTLACRENALLSGLAGSLKLEHLSELLEIGPGFIGFRGGICSDFLRETTLSPHKLHALRNLLLLNNEQGRKAEEMTLLSLHT